MTDDSPAVKDAVSIVRNRRTDAMFVAAFIMVAALVGVVVFKPDISEYAQGVITLALGTFIGYLTAMYQFETGTTRGAQAKDATIKSMAEIGPAQTAAAVAATVAANVAAAIPAPLDTIPIVKVQPAVQPKEIQS